MLYATPLSHLCLPWRDSCCQHILHMKTLGVAKAQATLGPGLRAQAGEKGEAWLLPKAYCRVTERERESITAVPPGLGHHEGRSWELHLVSHRSDRAPSM